MKTPSKQHQPLVLTKSTFIKIAVFLGSLFFSIACMASIPVPPYSAQVVDLTSTLSTSEKTNLIQTLSEFEQNSRQGAQFAVLIVPTTEEESIEQFATRVFDQWKIGKKDRDNGVLLLVAKEDRTLRIEVGYGLEGAITDVTSGRIIRNTILPEFQQNNYFAGIKAGVTQLTALINQEITADDITEKPDVEGYVMQFLFMSVYVSVMVYVVFSGLQRKIRGILPATTSTNMPTASTQTSPSRPKAQPTLGKKMRWGHYILSILGLNGIMFLLNGSNGAMLTPVVILLTILASFLSCGIASLVLNNFIQPGQSMQSVRGSSRRGGGRGGFGGGGFGGGGFGGGGGGRSGGGGASGRW